MNQMNILVQADQVLLQDERKKSEFTVAGGAGMTYGTKYYIHASYAPSELNNVDQPC